jgi:hypothetical protein
MRIGALLGMAVAVAACGESPVAPLRTLHESPPQTAVVTEEQLTLQIKKNVFVSCANGGAGETVQLIGQVELRTHSVEDDNGGVHFTSHARPTGVQGVGSVTGAIYRGHGATITGERYYPDGLPASERLNHIFRVIGEGRGNNFHLHAVITQTWDENGALQADVDVNVSSCK